MPKKRYEMMGNPTVGDQILIDIKMTK
jgi:hypothetical protein